MAMPGGVDMGAILSDQLMKAAAVVEDQIDAEMAKMEKLPDEDELEVRIWNIYGHVLVRESILLLKQRTIIQDLDYYFYQYLRPCVEKEQKPWKNKKRKKLNGELMVMDHMKKYQKRKSFLM